MRSILLYLPTHLPASLRCPPRHMARVLPGGVGAFVLRLGEDSRYKSSLVELTPPPSFREIENSGIIDIYAHSYIHTYSHIGSRTYIHTFARSYTYAHSQPLELHSCGLYSAIQTILNLRRNKKSQILPPLHPSFPPRPDQVP